MVKQDKKWFKVIKKIMKIFIKETKFTYLGEKITNSSIILSNHEGTSAPLSFELYSGKPIKFWGAEEMASGLKKVYKYQSKIYYHKKKHWNLFLSRLFCLIASPLTNLFYKGLQIIPIYSGLKYKVTINKTIEELKKGNNIVIFPENSEQGYLKELCGFHNGFYILFQYCLKKGIDVPVYIVYNHKDRKENIIDKPILISELMKENLSKEELAQKLCDRCNELGRM